MYKWWLLWLTSLSLTTKKHRYRSTNIFIKISRTFIESVSQDDCQSENVSCQRWEKCRGDSCWWQAMFTNALEHSWEDNVSTYLCSKDHSVLKILLQDTMQFFCVKLLSFVNILLWVGDMTRLWSFFMAWATVGHSGPGYIILLLYFIIIILLLYYISGQVLEEDSARGDKTDSAHCPKGTGHPSGWERVQLMVRPFSTRLRVLGYESSIKRIWEDMGLTKAALSLKMKSNFPLSSC